MSELKRIWVTRDGKHLKIKDMESDHIKNCISFLRKVQNRQINQMSAFGGILHGECAIDQFERDFDALCESIESGEDTVSEYIKSFECELDKRRKIE